MSNKSRRGEKIEKALCIERIAPFVHWNIKCSIQKWPLFKDKCKDISFQGWDDITRKKKTHKDDIQNFFFFFWKFYSTSLNTLKPQCFRCYTSVQIGLTKKLNVSKLQIWLLCARASEEEQKLDTQIMGEGEKTNKKEKVMQWQARCEKPPDATDFVHRESSKKIP